jgi:hypothetical protein
VRTGEWVAKVRKDREALAADLGIAVLGMVIIVFGGVVAVTGIERATNNNSAPNPVLGNTVADVGLVVIALGLILALTNLLFWLTGPRRRPPVVSADKRTNQELLQQIRDREDVNRPVPDRHP